VKKLHRAQYFLGGGGWDIERNWKLRIENILWEKSIAPSADTDVDGYKNTAIIYVAEMVCWEVNWIYLAMDVFT